MITKKKLEIYRHFNGDIDGWARVGTPIQKESISDKDWKEIDDILQELFLIKEMKLSVESEKRVYQKLLENTDNESTINELKSMT